jgi:hypothetical protein
MGNVALVMNINSGLGDILVEAALKLERLMAEAYVPVSGMVILHSYV